MKERNYEVDKNGYPILYGDRVRLVQMSGRCIEGIYAGDDSNGRSIVTVTHPDEIRGAVLYPKYTDIEYIQENDLTPESSEPESSTEYSEVDNLIDIRDSVLDDFDFDRVHIAMEALDWEWFDTRGVPTAAEIRKESKYLLDRLIDRYIETGTGGIIATGGLQATLETYPDDVPSLCIQFCVEESCSAY